tara:strand:- start:4190 stop:4954 length:765 start_codon:yes stop_codon:yes gene_type:complete
MKKIIYLIILSFLISVNSLAADSSKDGDVKDCFEGVNRGIFAFNKALDNVIVEPLATGYRKLPSPIRTGTSNFLSNLSLLSTIPNNVLQGDLGLAGKNTSRLLINSTVGILGLFDPATSFGLNNYEREDYGQTLAKWGVDEGCYIVLPILGPSTLRDTTGKLVNYFGGDPWYNITVRNDTQYVSEFDYYTSVGTSGVDFRAKNLESFNNLEENSMDFYASVKSLYLQDRKKKILNSDDITDTFDDSDWEEIEAK